MRMIQLSVVNGMTVYICQLKFGEYLKAYEICDALRDSSA